MRATQKASLLIGTLAVMSAAACGRQRSPADAGLARDLAAAGGSTSSDLQLAPHAGSAQTVVSAIEAGPQAAPKHATRAPVAKPVTHPAPLRAAPRQPEAQSSVAQAAPAP